MTLECYRITRDFPQEERFAMVQQIRRAALSTHVNIAEDCSRKSEAERKRFFEVSRGAVSEVNTALDIACELRYKTEEERQPLGNYPVSTFKQLSGLIGGKKKEATDSLLITHHSSFLNKLVFCG